MHTLQTYVPVLCGPSVHNKTLVEHLMMLRTSTEVCKQFNVLLTQVRISMSIVTYGMTALFSHFSVVDMSLAFMEFGFLPFLCWRLNLYITHSVAFADFADTRLPVGHECCHHYCLKKHESAGREIRMRPGATLSYRYLNPRRTYLHQRGQHAACH